MQIVRSGRYAAASGSHVRCRNILFSFLYRPRNGEVCYVDIAERMKGVRGIGSEHHLAGARSRAIATDPEIKLVPLAICKPNINEAILPFEALDQGPKDILGPILGDVRR